MGIVGGGIVLADPGVGGKGIGGGNVCGERVMIP